MSIKSFALTSITTVLASFTLNSFASHHFESELSKKYPQFDLTDVYVFESENEGFTSFVMDINPTTLANEAPLFGEDGVYSFHIANDRSLKEGGMTITAHIESNEIIFGILDGANQAVGAKGNAVGRSDIGTEKTLENGMRVWSGVARDLFVGNSAGIREFTSSLSSGELKLSAFDEGVDLFKDLNSSIIVVELPNEMLAENIYVYATSAMYLVDKWEQVNRVANPLITHLFMKNNVMEVAEHVGHRPDSDASRQYAISSNVLRAVALDGKIDNPVEYADSVAKQLLPDLIPYKVGTKADYGFASINGRALDDDAMDAVLSIFIGREFTDNANTFDRHHKAFPYVEPN